MRLLFLAKRQPQQRDLIDRPYGRFHHLPVALAALGHDVRVQLCSHRGLDSTQAQRQGVQWSSHDLRTLGPHGLLRRIESEARAFRPDWIIGCSDTWYGWLAHRLARRCDASLAIDAYDNYEAYMPWNVPLHFAWRRALREADLVTAAGPQLAALLQEHRPKGSRSGIVPMAADPGFSKLDKAQCRAALGLAPAAPLVGYSGGWTRSRGTWSLLDGFRRLRARIPDCQLVLSGRPPADACNEPGVVSLGYLDDAQLPLLLNALDVAAIVTANTAFGRYSYPAKLCEAMACGVPVVATATEPVRWMLNDDPRFLVPPGSTGEMADRMLSNLELGSVDYGVLPSWHESSLRFDALLAA